MSRRGPESSSSYESQGASPRDATRELKNAVRNFQNKVNNTDQSGFDKDDATNKAAGDMLKRVLSEAHKSGTETKDKKNDIARRSHLESRDIGKIVDSKINQSIKTLAGNLNRLADDTQKLENSTHGILVDELNKMEGNVTGKLSSRQVERDTNRESTQVHMLMTIGSGNYNQIHRSVKELSLGSVNMVVGKLEGKLNRSQLSKIHTNFDRDLTKSNTAALYIQALKKSIGKSSRGKEEPSQGRTVDSKELGRALSNAPDGSKYLYSCKIIKANGVPNGHMAGKINDFLAGNNIPSRASKIEGLMVNYFDAMQSQGKHITLPGSPQPLTPSSFAGMSPKIQKIVFEHSNKKGQLAEGVLNQITTPKERKQILAAASRERNSGNSRGKMVQLEGFVKSPRRNDGDIHKFMEWHRNGKEISEDVAETKDFASLSPHEIRQMKKRELVPTARNAKEGLDREFRDLIMEELRSSNSKGDKALASLLTTSYEQNMDEGKLISALVALKKIMSEPPAPSFASATPDKLRQLKRRQLVVVAKDATKNVSDDIRDQVDMDRFDSEGAKHLDTLLVSGPGSMEKPQIIIPLVELKKRMG